MSAITVWMLGAAEKEALFQTRGFTCESVETEQQLENAGKYFLVGYNNCLNNSNFNQLQELLEDVELPYRGFSYEGAAMGYAMLDVFSFKKHRFQNYINTIGKHHIYMAYVGAGWAYAKLPVNIESRIANYDPLLKWLAIDGYGFCHAYFNTKKYVADKAMPNLSDYGKHVFYQGLGRCLWFVEGANPDRIAYRIKTFPEKYASDLWAGIGLASAYAGAVDKATIEKIKELGQPYILNIGQGAAFAAAARIEAGNLVPHTDLANFIYSGISAQTASDITEDSRKTIATLHNDLPAYENWRRKISSSLSEISMSPRLVSSPITTY